MSLQADRSLRQKERLMLERLRIDNMTLRCCVGEHASKGYMRGVSIATCCHHLCQWKHYINKGFLLSLGITKDEFHAITCSIKKTFKAFARIENHYFVNRGFFSTDTYLLDNIEKIKHINAVIVQGRYDCYCPMMSAWDLHKAWPEADFKVVPGAGHSANEPGIAAELVAANEKLKNIRTK